MKTFLFGMLLVVGSFIAYYFDSPRLSEFLGVCAVFSIMIGSISSWIGQGIPRSERKLENEPPEDPPYTNIGL